jgi:hypothetical protein
MSETENTRILKGTNEAFYTEETWVGTMLLASWNYWMESER